MNTEHQPTQYPSLRHHFRFPRIRRTRAGISKRGETSENTSGMYSERCRKKLVLCARKMSGAKPARLNKANSSTQIWGLRYHLTSGSMGFAQFLGGAANFDQMLQNGIV